MDGRGMLIRSLKRILLAMEHRGLLNWLPDKAYIKLMFRLNMGMKLNLEKPQTYNEKLQWLKLHDRKPEYTQMVDKYEAKKYIASVLGDACIIPTLGIWNHFDEIDFAALPNQFVLKCTHDSGGLVICRDKASFDREAARKKINRSLKTNYFYHGREWPYKNVKPRIIAEAYLEDSNAKELRDFKFYCFDGKAKSILVASDRCNPAEETKVDFFDMDYNHLPIIKGHPNAKIQVPKPISFSSMVSMAEKISAGIPHLRVDFYEVDGKPYLGELTFFSASGYTPFEPEEYDKIMGDYLRLPQK